MSISDDIVESLAAKIKDAYYAARDNGGTMHTAADDAARAVLDSGLVVPAHPNLPGPPTGDDYECCASGSCEVCKR